MEESQSLTEIPEDWKVEKTRFLYKLVDPEGNDVLFGLTEEACRRCLYCLPEFGGCVSEPIAVGSYKL